jgi:hypothetical protein
MLLPRRVRAGTHAMRTPLTLVLSQYSHCPPLCHCPQYLDSLESPAVMARVAEFPPLALLPAFLVRSKFTLPNLYHVGGTILAGAYVCK